MTGLANGSIAENSKDAVTGGQLNQTQDAIGKLLGGGAKIDSNGNVYYDENGAALTVNGQGYKTVAEAIDQGSLFRVQGEEIVVNGATGATSVNFSNGDSNRVIKGVADGSIAENPKEVVNGGSYGRLIKKWIEKLLALIIH